MNDEFINTTLDSAEWSVNQASILKEKYKSCQTANEQRKILSQLECIKKKMSFERNELNKLMGTQ